MLPVPKAVRKSMRSADSIKFIAAKVICMASDQWTDPFRVVRSVVSIAILHAQ